MQQNITFLELIRESRIEIPVIQRDYAQGRDEEKVSEIRSNFLAPIVDCLSADDISEPLVLNFVYGSSSEGVFHPLDGQQRLTTLFLLHWYLAGEEGIEALRRVSEDTGWGQSIASRFTYQTRISSKNFCDELVRHPLGEILESYGDTDGAHVPLSAKIKDQTWYMWDWSKDPTIAGMLVMLDDIDERLADFSGNLWERLAAGRRVVFHLLELAEFNLTDELYVKMNARGKELSPFDIFKSTLEEQMRVNDVPESIQDHWRKNIDSRWIDLFWNNARGRLVEGDGTATDESIVAEVEDSYLRYLKRLMVFHLFLCDDCLELSASGEIRRELSRLKISPDTEDIMPVLREMAVTGDILRLTNLFCKAGFFDERFFRFVIEVIDGSIYRHQETNREISALVEGVRFEESSVSLFERFIDRGVTYETRVLYFALASFARYNNASGVHPDEGLRRELNDWMRVIRNLATNVNSYMYNTYRDFQRSIREVDRWARHIYGPEGAGSVIRFFSSDEPRAGFPEDQLREEAVKARLMGSGDWKAAIRSAEEHPYFIGQIPFLLDWAGDDIDLFEIYRKKADALFGDSGVGGQVDENLFRSALLARGDYYMPFGGSRYSLLSGGKAREHTWKRFLREKPHAEVLRLLLEDYDPAVPFNDYFRQVAAASTVEDWRKYFIREPRLFNYQSNVKKVISWWYWNTGEIMVLQKERTSAPYAELRTLFWQMTLGRVENYLDSRNEHHPFSAVFPIGEGDVSVKYITGYYEDVDSVYVLSSSFEDQALTHVPERGRWEREFPSGEADLLEQTLRGILDKYPDRG